MSIGRHGGDSQRAELEVVMSFLRAHAPPQPTPTPDDNNGCEGVGEHDEAQAEEMEVLSPLPSRQLDPASHVWPGVDARCTRLHKRCYSCEGGWGWDSGLVTDTTQVEKSCYFPLY